VVKCHSATLSICYWYSSLKKKEKKTPEERREFPTYRIRYDRIG